jgi:hypothetical protein
LCIKIFSADCKTSRRGNLHDLFGRRGALDVGLKPGIVLDFREKCVELFLGYER